MAGAPHKQSLDYYAFEVTTFDSVEIQDLIETHQAEGFMFWMQLKSAIFSSGNYLLWEKFARRQFRKKHEYTDAQIEVYIAYLLDIGLLNKKMYKTYGILTSQVIQGTYLLSTKGRSKVIYIQEYLLISFNDFHFLDQTVHLMTIDGELIERFIKKGGVKLNPETKQPLDGPQSKASGKSKVTPTKPVPAAEKPAESYTPYTHQDVLDFIKTPYAEQDEVFSSTYTKEEYDAYVLLNKKINDRYPKIRKSNRQLTFPEYIGFIEELTPTDAELIQAFKKLSEQPIKKDTDIYQQLGVYLQVVSNAPLPEESGPEYVRDEAYEVSVIDFWGLTPTTHHRKLVFVSDFCKVMSATGQQDEFKKQFTAYKEYIGLAGVGFRFSIDNFLGKQAERFEDGKWLNENWELKVQGEKAKNNRSIISTTNATTTNRLEADKDKGYGKF